ncbi:MAG TPA: hypothetical protein VF646_04895 [Cytophagales bacterium]|jgi:hypothetical protein
MKSIKFTEATRIRERPEVIFDYTQDYGNRLQWDTFLKRADLVDGATAAGKGVKSYCVARNGIGMETVYVSRVVQPAAGHGRADDPGALPV